MVIIQYLKYIIYMKPEKFSLDNLGKLSRKEIAKQEERKAYAKWVKDFEKRKKGEEEERGKDIEEMRKKIEQPPKTTKSEAIAAKEPEKELTREDATLYFAKQLEKIEAELLDRFQYEAAKDSWWKRLRLRVGLSKKDKEKFDKLLASYKNTEESHLKRAREAGKEL